MFMLDGVEDERSPQRFMLDGVEDPLEVYHGDADWNVPLAGLLLNYRSRKQMIVTTETTLESSLVYRLRFLKNFSHTGIQHSAKQLEQDRYNRNRSVILKHFSVAFFEQNLQASQFSGTPPFPNRMSLKRFASASNNPIPAAFSISATMTDLSAVFPCLEKGSRRDWLIG